MASSLIDAHRDRCGVEPVRRVLQVAPACFIVTHDHRLAFR